MTRTREGNLSKAQRILSPFPQTTSTARTILQAPSALQRAIFTTHKNIAFNAGKLLLALPLRTFPANCDHNTDNITGLFSFAPGNIPTEQEYSVQRRKICADTAAPLSAATGNLTPMFVRGVNEKTDNKCQRQQAT
ncbi:hypothetical protein HMPREF1981_02865 [Bacteroides pyogenes F0041]|uniref:Uncharacterized protein n=2 Tax=Bacteroides pyogenes TaxID=310300 RepID=U2BUK0_9BACE|nr:hypothetical protein [Bacteroides pyogenes]ERI81859.1 hypothetical protein HMPREF1981_02865 [Bacteroides pyogenes F0041]MBB3895617.1 hypothetical protein [Bacteroides pyogenes]